MTAGSVVGQIVSIIAMLVTIFSFQMKRREKILLFQIIGNALFLLSYFLLGSWSAAAINIVFLVRNIVYMLKNKYRRLDNIFTVILFGALSVIVGILTWSSPRDLFIIIGSLFGCVALYMNNETHLFVIKAGDSICWLIYNSISFVLGGILCEVANLISIVFAVLVRRKITAKKHKQ